MKKPVPLPPIASGNRTPSISYRAPYAPHTRTTEGLAIIAICCCGLAGGAAAAWVAAARPIPIAHARRMSNLITGIVPWSTLLELADGGELAALAVHSLDRGGQHGHGDRFAAARGDERGALGGDLDVAARQLVALGERAVLELVDPRARRERAPPQLLAQVDGGERELDVVGEPAAERLVDRLGEVRGQDRQAVEPLEPLQEVVDLEVGEPIVGGVDLGGAL